MTDEKFEKMVDKVIAYNKSKNSDDLERRVAMLELNITCLRRYALSKWVDKSNLDEFDRVWSVLFEDIDLN